MPKPKKTRLVLLSDLVDKAGTVHVEINIISALFWQVEYSNESGQTSTINKSDSNRVIQLASPKRLKGKIHVFQINFVPDSTDDRKYLGSLTWCFKMEDGSIRNLVEDFTDEDIIKAKDTDPIIVCSAVFT